MLRVGTVPYLVGRPLDRGLEEAEGIRFEARVPAELVRGLREGDLDVALVSSVELFRQPGYRYLDGWAVAGRGRVSSVQVFLRRALEEVRSVALDPASRMAAALSQIVWPGPRPEFRPVPPGEDPRDQPADAWLRIGDVALVETFAEDAPETFNPSEAWTAETGHELPYAVWIVRPGVEVEPHVGAFAAARERGRAATEEVARATAEALRIPLEASRRYFFDEIDYEPGAALTPALAEFHGRAVALDLVRADCVPRPVEGLRHA